MRPSPLDKEESTSARLANSGHLAANVLVESRRPEAKQHDPAAYQPDAPVVVRVPNGLAWHPDWDSCMKLHECAAQRPSLPRLTMPIPPIGTLTPLAR